MASVFEAAKLIIGDSHPIYKIATIAILPFITYNFYESQNWFMYNLFLFLTIIIFLGFLSIIVHQSINEELTMLPRPNPFKLFGKGFKAFIMLIPFIAVVMLLGGFLSGLVNLEPMQKTILTSIIYSVLGTFCVTPLLFYSREFKMTDGYNLKLVFKVFHEIIIHSLIFVVMAIVVNAVLFGVLGFFIHMLFGFSKVFNYYIAFVISANVAFYGSYLGILHYELFFLTQD